MENSTLERHKSAWNNAAEDDRKNDAWKPLKGITPISIIELTIDTCRFPVNTEDGIMYCGGQVAHKVYCAAHHRVAYVPSMPRKNVGVRRV